MRIIAVFVFLVSFTAQAATCSVTITEASEYSISEVKLHLEHDVKFGALTPYQIESSRLSKKYEGSFLLGSTRTSPDTYIEYVQISGASPAQCKPEFLFAKNADGSFGAYIGVASHCEFTPLSHGSSSSQVSVSCIF